MGTCRSLVSPLQEGALTDPRLYEALDAVAELGSDEVPSPGAKRRCKAVTFAGQPDHLLTRCSLEEGHLAYRDHVPSFSDEDRNYC